MSNDDVSSIKPLLQQQSCAHIRTKSSSTLGGGRNSLFLNTAVLIFSIHIRVLTGHCIKGSVRGTSNLCEWTGRAKPKSHTSTHVPFLTVLWVLQLSSLPLRCLMKCELFKGPKHHPHKFAQLVLALLYSTLFIRIVTDLSSKPFETTTGILRGCGKKKKI